MTDIEYVVVNCAQDVSKIIDGFCIKTRALRTDCQLHVRNCKYAWLYARL